MRTDSGLQEDRHLTRTTEKGRGAVGSAGEIVGKYENEMQLLKWPTLWLEQLQSIDTQAAKTDLPLHKPGMDLDHRHFREKALVHRLPRALVRAMLSRSNRPPEIIQIIDTTILFRANCPTLTLRLRSTLRSIPLSVAALSPRCLRG